MFWKQHHKCIQELNLFNSLWKFTAHFCNSIFLCATVTPLLQHIISITWGGSKVNLHQFDPFICLQIPGANTCKQAFPMPDKYTKSCSFSTVCNGHALFSSQGKGCPEKPWFPSMEISKARLDGSGGRCRTYGRGLGMRWFWWFDVPSNTNHCMKRIINFICSNYSLNNDLGIL